MFTQFRIHYPQGSFLSEFVTVDRGQYLVRVLIQDQGITLASGLAAAETIEKAEDKARERAFAALGIDFDTSTSTSTDNFDSKPQIELSQPQNNFSASTPTPTKAAKVEEFTFHHANSQSTIPESITSESLQKAPDFSVTTETLPEEIVPAPPQESFTKPAAINPIDMSDVIIQTDIEMKRLNWGKKEGVDHLLQTYGKRTRTSLTDQELKEFLQYLQSQ
ncbi:MAG: hypothetical protein WBG70_11065 [Spirulinaceae cyanobacterium]